MREENMDFGQFIRSKRLKDSRELTLISKKNWEFCCLC